MAGAEVQAAALGMNKDRVILNWNNSEAAGNDLVRTERSQSTLEARVNGPTQPVCQENTWDEDEQALTRLILSIEERDVLLLLQENWPRTCSPNM